MTHKANLTWLTDNLATGGDFAYLDAVAGEQLADLIDQDLDLIIDCRMEADDAELWAGVQENYGLNIEYVHMPTDDHEGHSIGSDYFDAAVQAAGIVLDGGGKVFVHCHMGINRGPSTAFAILLDQGMDPIEAFDLIREKRPIAGIAYAEDALAAHMKRNSILTEDAIRLKWHIDKMIGPKERVHIKRALADMHESDRRQYQEGRM